jgi:hypothetical protein
LITSSSQYALWEAEFNVEWQRADRLSYEFALLRQAITGLFAAPKDLDYYMLNKMIRKQTPYDWMSEEEKEDVRARNKATARKHGFKMPGE